MKIYVMAVLLVTYLITLFGMLVPYLISAKSDESVTIGLLIIVVSLPLIYFGIAYIIKEVSKLNRRRRKR